MKYFNLIRTLIVALVFLGASGISYGQADTSHPLSFPIVDGGANSNWYKDYVGIRFEVSSPASIAGPKVYTTAYDTPSTGFWGGPFFAMIDSPVKFAPAPDTTATTAFPTDYFAGKIALVWRGSGVEFGQKALYAQNAGAVACVIVNNVTGGPVGMAAGTYGAGVTIPVYMISLEDGTAIANILNAGGSVNMTILINWLTGHANDVGFVPEGYSLSANNAMPYTQINAHSAAYKSLDGGFVANYGTNIATNVKLKGDLSWTPAGGSATLVHSDSVTKYSFPTIDSIWAMYAPQYDLPTLTGPGTFTLNYSLSTDSTDGFLGDNNQSYTFYATDSLYSKGRYDFVNNHPSAALYEQPNTASGYYTWGVPYYVANGGDVFDSLKFSVAAGVGLLASGSYINVYLFKWDDSITPDSLMENEDLQLLGVASKFFDGTSDSSFDFFTSYISGDTLGGGFDQVFTTSNSWYFLAAEVPVGTALGVDGVVDGFPRAYGRGHFADNNYREYYSSIYGGDRYNNSPMIDNGGVPFYPWAFDGTGSYDIDSVEYASQKGLIPAISFTTTKQVSAVKNVASDFSKFNIYPNPATSSVNVALELSSAAKQVTYTVIDGSARTVSKETHYNVQNEVYNLNTNNFPSGVYYMIINADDKHTFKKFTVIR